MYLAQLYAKRPTIRAVRSPRGSSRRAVRLAGFAATSLVVCGLGLWQPMADGAAATTGSCPGRAALTCSQRTALYNAAVSSAIGGFGALDLFRAPRAQRLGNPALATFWRYEAATGITRYEYSLAIGSPGIDLLFESPVQAARPSAPVIKRNGIVTRSMARAMSQLISAEQQVAVNLVAMDTALNRAAGAVSRSRADWSRYLAYVAAGFARRTADAIGTVIPRQRAVTKALVRARLMFGIGPADQKAQARYVNTHGFPNAITQIMLKLGMNSVALSYARLGFVHAKPSSKTLSMSQYLSSATVIRNEQTLASELRGFANSVPAASQPPD